MNKTTCKHFNGIQHDCCDAGVTYKSVTTDPEQQLGRALRIPCITEHKGNLSSIQQEHYNRRGVCPKFELPTTEEVQKYEEEVKAHSNRMMTAIAATMDIRKQHKGQDWSGIVECPICKGKLHISHAAYNGHIWGQCETKDCVAWIE